MTYALAFVATHSENTFTSIATYTAANANHITHVVYIEKPMNLASTHTQNMKVTYKDRSFLTS